MVSSFNKNHIDNIVQEEGSLAWQFMGFYCESKPKSCHLSWTLLQRLSDSDTLSWVVGRDFNAILREEEKEKGSLKSPKDMMEFQEALNYGVLRDLGWEGL